MAERKPVDPRCICPHGMGHGSVFYKVRMSPEWCRLSTTKGCLAHDACQGYTKANRAARPSWSNPYCPIHKTRDCPAGEDGHG